MRSARSALSYKRSAVVGALLGVVAILLSRAFGNSPSDNNSIAYWGGVAVGGGLVGVAVAAIKNRGHKQ